MTHTTYVGPWESFDAKARTDYVFGNICSALSPIPALWSGSQKLNIVT